MFKPYAAAALILLPIALAGCSHPHPVYYAPPPPPSAWSQIAQQGYHDGIDAAHADIRRGLPPDINRHPRFRNPPVPQGFGADYRRGFEQGYTAVFQH